MGERSDQAGREGGREAGRSADPFDLQRFVAAQDAQQTYPQALAELRAGRKTGHWIWFVFPQLAGLGLSSTSKHYAVSGLSEARAYLDHPVLGARLVQCSTVVHATVPGHSAESILGGIDATKLRSSMTLFARVDAGQPVFAAVLDRYFEGVADPRTEELLADS